MQVQALEALIDYQVEVGRLLGPYYVWLYDAGKYGVGVLGEYWDTERIAYGQLVEMPDPQTGATSLFQSTVELEGYTGNKVYNVNPFDFWMDPRVTMKNFQSGEFCFVLKRMLWNDVQRRVAAGYYTNVENLKRHATTRHADDNSQQLKRPDWATAWSRGPIIQRRTKMNRGNIHQPSLHTSPMWMLYARLGNRTREFRQKWCSHDHGRLRTHHRSKVHLEICMGGPTYAPRKRSRGIFRQVTRGIPEIVTPLQDTRTGLSIVHFLQMSAPR
jgi:hypothetical protein